MALYVEYIDCDIDKLVCHKIGNKTRGDGVSMSSTPMLVNDYSKALFLNHILGGFTRNEYMHNLYHEADLSLNMVYRTVSRIFDNPNEFIQRSQEIARHLYEHSTNLKVKDGELFVVYLKDCIFNGETVDAVGIFKSENKARGLCVGIDDDCFALTASKFINADKLDRGCIIFNTDREDGYVVQVIDNVGKGTAEYWFNDFLHVRERRDKSYYTRNVMTSISSFIKKGIDNRFEISEIQRIELLNKAVAYFKTKDKFEIEEFRSEVLEQTDLVVSFTEYYNIYILERDIDDAPNGFMICDTTLKSNLKLFKPEINIDGKIKIRVNQIEGFISEEYDKDQNKGYYKIYFNK